MPLLQRRSEQPGFSPKTGRIPIWPRHPDLRAVRVKQEGVLIRRQVQFPHWSGRTREQTPTQHLNSRFTSFTFATSSISFCLFMFWQNRFLQEIKSNLVEDFIRSPNLYLNLGKSKTLPRRLAGGWTGYVLISREASSRTSQMKPDQQELAAKWSCDCIQLDNTRRKHTL